MSPKPLPNGMRALLDRPIAYHRVLATLTEGVIPGLMLSQAIYWQLRTTRPDGWWWKTREEWTEETGLTRSEQETARRYLKYHPWWSEKRRGIPARMHYKVDLDMLLEALDGINESSRHESCQLDGGDADRLPDDSHPTITKTTIDHSETTTPDAGGGLSWPADLLQKAREACERELATCPPELRADVVRELAYRLTRHDLEPIRLPHLWVRELVRVAAAGVFVRNAPSSPLSSNQRDAIERDYQRRLQISRERFEQKLASKSAGHPRKV